MTAGKQQNPDSSPGVGIKKPVISAADISSAEGEVATAYHRMKELQTLRDEYVAEAKKAAMDEWYRENGEKLQSATAAVRSAEERLRKLQVAKSELSNKSLIGTRVIEWAAIAWRSPTVYKPTGRRGIIEVCDGLPVNGKSWCRCSAGDLVVRLLRKDLSLSRFVVRMNSTWLKEGVRHKLADKRVRDIASAKQSGGRVIEVVGKKRGKKTAKSG